MTRAEAVQRFLQQNVGKEFCDKCLARAFGIKSVNRYILQLIHNPFFMRASAEAHVRAGVRARHGVLAN